MLRTGCIRDFRQHLFKVLVFVMMLSATISCKSRTDTRRPIDYRLHNSEEVYNTLKNLEEDPDNLRANISIWGYYTEKGQLDEVVRYAVPVFRRFTKEDMSQLRLYSGAYLAQAYLLKSQFDSANYYLNDIASMTGYADTDPFFRAMIHNTSGMLALQSEMDYSKALDEFKNAYGILTGIKDTSNQIILLGNISSIYTSRKDTSGFRYASEAYSLSRTIDNPYAKITSTVLLAQMHLLKKDYKQAMILTDEASELAMAHPQFITTVYCCYANIYYAEGNIGKAEYYFQKALQSKDESEPPAVIQTYLDYGHMLYSEGRDKEAAYYYDLGIDMSKEINNIQYLHSLILAKSDVEYSMGNKDAALELYKSYHHLSDSIFTIQKERAFQRLEAESEKTALNERIKNKELELEKSEKRGITAIFISGILALFLAGVVTVNRKQKKFYRRLVEAHQQYLIRTASIKHQKTAEFSLEKAHEEVPKELALWQKVEKLMDEDKVYKMKDISLDKIAEMVGSNRAYISRVINQYAGMSFYTYINSRRIEDAIKILSGPDRDVTMKQIADELGYNSLSAFYRVFQKETGCPPSKYREELKSIHIDDLNGLPNP